MSGWVGVDLDGTLAHYSGWHGPTDIGTPIQPMVDRVKKWLSEGREVRILTARASIPEINERYKDRVRQHLIDQNEPSSSTDVDEHIAYWHSKRKEIIGAIEDWCLEHIGQVLPVTAVKDFGMVELWDDRAVRVIYNTGERCCQR